MVDKQHQPTTSNFKNIHGNTIDEKVFKMKGDDATDQKNTNHFKANSTSQLHEFSKNIQETNV